MKIERKFTKSGQDAYAGIEFVSITSEIRNPDGTSVFKAENVEIPAGWSQVAGAKWPETSSRRNISARRVCL